MKKVAIVIPTYNERVNVAKLIPQIYKQLPVASVLVVDDSSTDGTAQEVKKMSKKYSSLRLLERTKKDGRGSAVMDGFAFAKKVFNPDIYIEMDADLSHDPKELKNIIAASKSKTVVIASRYIRGSRIINWQLERRIASRVSNILVRVILGIPLRDNTNGYRCYSKEAVKDLLSEKFISGGYIVLTETSYILMKKGYSFVELPSIFYNRRSGRSNTNVSEFLNAFFTLLKLRMR